MQDKQAEHMTTDFLFANEIFVICCELIYSVKSINMNHKTNNFVQLRTLKDFLSFTSHITTTSIESRMLKFDFLKKHNSTTQFDFAEYGIKTSNRMMSKLEKYLEHSESQIINHTLLFDCFILTKVHFDLATQIFKERIETIENDKQELLSCDILEDNLKLSELSSRMKLIELHQSAQTIKLINEQIELTNSIKRKIQKSTEIHNFHMESINRFNSAKETINDLEMVKTIIENVHSKIQSYLGDL